MHFIAVVGIIFVIFAILVLIYISPMCSMHPLASGNVEETDIIAIRNRSNNLFFIPSNGEWLVIDAGSDAGAVKREMEKMAIDGRRVKGVFLTHSDYDHVASLPLFPHAAIYMSKKEKQMVDGSTLRQFIKKNRLPGRLDLNKIVWLSDRESVDLCGHRIRVVSVPGHTKGSAMYVADERYLFTGDAFKVEDGHISVHPYSMNRKQAQETIYSIKEELQKYEMVFTAHYGLLSRKKD